MPQQLTNLAVEFVSLVDRAAVRSPSNPTEPQKFLLWKSERGAPDPKGGSMPQTAEELQAALKKAEEERDAAKADLAKAEKKLAKKDKGDEPETAKVDKSALPAEVRELIEKNEQAAQDAVKRAEKAEQLAKAERDTRVEKEFVAKAEAEFPHLGNPGELGPRLKRMSETLSKEDYEAHYESLKAANEQIAKGSLFAELGRGGEQPAASDDLDKLAKAVQEIRKSDTTLSEYQAREEALRRDPALAAALVTANR